MLNRTVAVCERVTLGTDNDAQHTGDTRQAPKVIPSNQITDLHSTPPQRSGAHQYKFCLLTNTATSNAALGYDTFQEDETAYQAAGWFPVLVERFGAYLLNHRLAYLSLSILII